MSVYDNISDNTELLRIITRAGKPVDNITSDTELLRIIARSSGSGATWGSILGDIEDQNDLTERIKALSGTGEWGDITGDIDNQQDLIDKINNLVDSKTSSFNIFDCSDQVAAGTQSLLLSFWDNDTNNNISYVVAIRNGAVQRADVDYVITRNAQNIRVLTFVGEAFPLKANEHVWIMYGVKNSGVASRLDSKTPEKVLTNDTINTLSIEQAIERGYCVKTGIDDLVANNSVYRMNLYVDSWDVAADAWRYLGVITDFGAYSFLGFHNTYGTVYLPASGNEYSIFPLFGDHHSEGDNKTKVVMPLYNPVDGLRLKAYVSTTQPITVKATIEFALMEP